MRILIVESRFYEQITDNLVKGASGQAVQCLNLMFGFDERTALDAPALSP